MDEEISITPEIVEEIYTSFLPLKTIISNVNNWDFSFHSNKELAETHAWNSLAYHINTNSYKNRLSCWCDKCGMELFVYVSTGSIQEKVRSILDKRQILFDNLYTVNATCDDKIMEKAFGEAK